MTTEYNLANLNTYLKKVISSVSGIKNKEKVISRIVSLLDEASQIVDLSLSDLLDGLDFQPNNYQVEKFEAFLAELRSIFWLSHFGFTEIAPLPKKKKSIKIYLLVYWSTARLCVSHCSRMCLYWF